MTLPSARAADALVITDGAEIAGFIVERDGSFFAFNAEGLLLGEYENRTEAIRSIPRHEDRKVRR